VCGCETNILTLQSSTFHYTVSAKLYTVVTYNTQAFWPDRTLVDPLLINVHDQLLQTFHVLAVISNLWANVTAQFHQETATVG